MGASWGHLGGPFWLKSRLKIGQEPPRPLLEYFFSAPGPSPGPFGGHSGPFRGFLKNKRKIISPRKAPGGPKMTPQGGPERPSECQKCTPLGPETDSKETPREQSKWVRRAPISHTGKDEQQTDQLGFASFCWACKPTSTLGLDLTVPLRLSGSRGLGGMREAITIILFQISTPS